MKKFISILILFSLVLIGLVGCSSSSKSEEELKAEIKAELEAEAKLKEELKAEIKAEMEKEQPAQKEQPAASGQSSQNGSAEPAKENKEVDVKPREGQKSTENQNPAPNTQPPQGELQEIYEIGKEYKLNGLNQSGALDTFKVVKSNSQDPKDEFHLLVNGKKFEVNDLHPDWVRYDYKITKNSDSDGFVLVFSEFDVTTGIEIMHFYEYAPNYSLEPLGFVKPGITIEDMNIKALNYGGVTVGNKTFNFNDEAAGTAAGGEENSSLKLAGFQNENINGTQINFSDYSAVIVPKYNGINSSSLSPARLVLGSVTQGYLSMTLNFAVFGQLNNIEATYYEGMGSYGQKLEVESLYNADAQVEIWMPSGDMSYLEVTGYVDLGSGTQKVEFTLDDMRDDSEYKVILVK